MNEFVPAGRLSKVSEDGVLLQIQTEFSWRPRPRIATTVCLDGVVLHKIQKDWDAPVDTEPQQQAVENYINRQHDEVVTIIQSQKKSLVKGHRAGDVTSNLDSILQIEGVEIAWCLNSEGIVTAGLSSGENSEPGHSGLSRGLVELCDFIYDMSSIGEMAEGALWLGEYGLILVRFGADFYAVEVQPDIDVKDVMQRLHEVIGVG
jgi:hypothetical protein